MTVPTDESMHARIVDAIRAISARSFGTDHDAMATAAIEALMEWIEVLDQRMTESEAYRRGRAEGYAEAYRLFGPELNSLREKVVSQSEPTDDDEEWHWSLSYDNT